MNKYRISLGLILIATGIILNQLELQNDLVDFLMGILVGLGLGILISGLVKSKPKLK
ncbi:hypothetical protein HNV10_02280 [Winogradskyella litoriviva]|uniref:Glycine zipper family protein n=1 Tax=Winogradskyella litoriviva TaxID=1220182 RepID=A0ABX2E155_9FLAO|nr:hypothetical protein [Winogradskyella litoriviva]NRD22050.1 hypothetical protein [Winogradskyella litoriviva]